MATLSSTAKEATHHRAWRTLGTLMSFGFNTLVFVARVYWTLSVYSSNSPARQNTRTWLPFQYFPNHLKSHWGPGDKNIFPLPRVPRSLPSSNMFSRFTIINIERKRERMTRKQSGNLQGEARMPQAPVLYTQNPPILRAITTPSGGAKLTGCPERLLHPALETNKKPLSLTKTRWTITACTVPVIKTVWQKYKPRASPHFIAGFVNMNVDSEVRDILGLKTRERGNSHTLGLNTHFAWWPAVILRQTSKGKGTVA